MFFPVNFFYRKIFLTSDYLIYDAKELRCK